jgi:hypothetical protein
MHSVSEIICWYSVVCISITVTSTMIYFNFRLLSQLLTKKSIAYNELSQGVCCFDMNGFLELN